jgi:ABC-type nitrate/sulfonate/bicarbonate transport system substrate-binding protein|uniref:ABC transporter substrate-binding protein n=1 Tax=candidate division WOR-3 bacterium TaxID=2052148 RepID=A0A7C6A8H5_UNCW3
MNKLLNLIIVILIVALVFVIVYPQWQESRPVKVRLGCDSTVTAALFFIAEERGFFKENRIIPELVFFADGRKGLDALFSGTIDCGVFPWHLIFKRIADAKETVKVFISEDFRTSLPVEALIVKSNSKITKLADLRKKKIGYPNQIREIIPAMLEGAGFAFKDFNLVEMSNRELINAVTGGTVDAGLVLEPERYRSQKAGAQILIDAPLAKYIISPLPGAAIGYTRPYLEKNRKVCVRLKMACDAAIAFLDQKPEEARKIIEKYLGYAPDELSDCRLPDMQKLVEINKDMIKVYADRLKASGVLTCDIDVKPIFVEPVRLKP